MIKGIVKGLPFIKTWVSRLDNLNERTEFDTYGALCARPSFFIRLYRKKYSMSKKNITKLCGMCAV